MRNARNETAHVVWPDAWLIQTLLDQEVICTGDLDSILDARETTAWLSCVSSGAATDESILAAVAKKFAMPIADLNAIDPDARLALKEEQARKWRVVPLRQNGRTLEAATSDALSHDLEANVSFACGKRVRMYLATEAQVDELIEHFYPKREVIAGLLSELGEATPVLRNDSIEASPEKELPLVKLVDALISQAIKDRASDIHLDPDPLGLSVRSRIDGVLIDVERLPPGVAAPLASRLKVMAGLDIADRLRPQDGRAEAVVDGRRVDLRISTLPVRGRGETIVIRILDSTSAPPALSSLGMTQSEQYRIERILSGEEGLFLVTGPTGSGKTTTLYACLRALQRSGISIVTVEDPIEYRLEGATQVQVNEKIDLTFASVLRSMMRQDPDVILVGEIRDSETAAISIQASLTGHRVLSTLHTPDAASAVMRFHSLGADRGALSQALKGVVAQRLLRRICTSCRTEIKAEDLPAAQQALLGDVPVTALYRARGCSKCNNTGYYGRLAVTEVLVVTNTIARAVIDGADADRITQLGRAAGMRSLWETGLEHVCNGDTTLQELLDNVAPPVVEVEQEVEAPERVFSREMIDALLDSIRAEAPTTAPKVDPQQQGPLALIADDDRQVRRLFRIGLERTGYRVIEAADGEAALDVLKRVTLDVVLLDLNLPKLDGFGVLAAMRAGDCAEVPVVVCTGHDDPEIAQWAKDLGAADVVTKPIEPRMLASRLSALLSSVAA